MHLRPTREELAEMINSDDPAIRQAASLQLEEGGYSPEVNIDPEMRIRDGGNDSRAPGGAAARGTAPSGTSITEQRHESPQTHQQPNTDQSFLENLFSNICGSCWHRGGV
eukprot:Selendium_serpulae@DN8683_c0_g1_i1.p1